MTGYGKAVAQLQGKTISIEIKSLNSKQLDLNLRLPTTLRDRESELRSTIAKTLERGKADIILTIDYSGSELPSSINRDLAISYYRELLSIAGELGASGSDLLAIAMKMPDVTRAVREDTGADEWEKIQLALGEALQHFDLFRLQEGELLKSDFSMRVQNIIRLLNEVEPFELSRNTALREKLRQSVAEFIDNNSLDSNRFEQEIIYYLEKLDITEEKIRLKKHCDYFLETMEEDTSNGRKLSFVSQEIGREINTLGSKANDASIQKLVVQMKDELEKIKEQLANIL